MSEWRLPDDLIWHDEDYDKPHIDLRELACDACKGSGHRPLHPGLECVACHGTGLAGVEWLHRDGHGFFVYNVDPEKQLPKGHNCERLYCQLRLVVPLERSETHA